jgi:hypothetical protein
MSKKFEYDPVSNTLNLGKSEEEVKRQKARGFIVQLVSNEEELEQLKATGNGQLIKLLPILSNTEQNAAEFAQNNGAIVIGVLNYEMLKLQAELIENLAKQQNIELVRENFALTQQENK